MNQACAYPKQDNYGNMPESYIYMVRFYPSSDSFYAAIMWELATQICRFKQNSLGKDLYEKLNSLALEFPSVPGANNFYEHAKNLPAILETALLQEIGEFESFLCPYSIYLNYSCRCLLALICLKKGFGSEISLCFKPGTAIDEFKHLPLLSDFLNIAIEVINSPTSIILYCEGKPCQTRLLLSLAYLGGDDKEFAVACNKLTDTFALNPNQNLLQSHPFVYNLPISRIPSNPSPVNPIQSNTNIDFPQAACNLLKLQFEIFTEVNWEISQAEADALKILLKKLPDKSEYASYKNTISRRLKRYFCDHSQKAYFKFKCERKHCIECFKEEIALKSLQAHQIFCSCKKPLTQEEIKYFFDLIPQKSLEGPKFPLHPIAPTGTNSPSFPVPPPPPNGPSLSTLPISPTVPNNRTNPTGPPLSSQPIITGGTQSFITPQGSTGLLGPSSGQNIPTFPINFYQQIGSDPKNGPGTSPNTSLFKSSIMSPKSSIINNISSNPSLPGNLNQINSTGLPSMPPLPFGFQSNNPGISPSVITNQPSSTGLTNIPPLPHGLPNLPPNPISQSLNSIGSSELSKISNSQDVPSGPSIYIPGSLNPIHLEVTKQNNLTGTTMNTKVKFCEKCSVPINSSNLEEYNGKFYHKTCMPGMKN